jgi:signal transduction histidine kinase/ActR/RegA family two-component response regulator
LLCLHDLICAFGFESVQYLSIYGFLIFSLAIVGITMVKHIDMVEKIDVSARALAGSKKELELKIRRRTQDLSRGYKKLERVVERLRQSERRNRVLSDQTEQFSLAAASMLMIENEQEFFDTVCNAIVKYSDYKRVLMSLFKPTHPFRDIIGYGGVEPEVVDRLRQVEMKAGQYDHVFEQGEKIGHQSFYIPHTMKDILKTEATLFGTGDSTGRENAWHPQDNLFVKMINEKGEFVGVISVDESKSGLRPTHETVRPLEIFSNLISQIIAFKKEQKKNQYLEEQLMQARKMESIGTLTGGIAHDFNNILGVIIGNAELALERLEKSHDVYSGLESIKYAGNKAADIVRQLLSFGRKSEVNMRLMGVEPLLDDLLRLVRATIPAFIKIKTRFRPEQSVILADPVQLNQVFLNLCLNAAQSMEQGGGTITLACDTRQLTRESCHEFPGLEPGPHILISVSDNGPGIPLDIQDRIFDPYFTTKEVGKGSGIGLSVVHGIVKSHQGAVSVKSRPGEGTIFEVLFPLKGGEPEAVDLKTASVERGRQESILVVDDEQMVLYIMGKLLTQLGYGVTEVSDPEKALEIFRAAPERFDLIITDMTMPGMSGMVLTRKILEIDPEKPVIICTGYNDVINGKTASDLSVSALLMKPVRMGTLAVEIQTALKKGS